MPDHNDKRIPELAEAMQAVLEPDLKTLWKSAEKAAKQQQREIPCPSRAEIVLMERICKPAPAPAPVVVIVRTD